MKLCWNTRLASGVWWWAVVQRSHLNLPRRAQIPHNNGILHQCQWGDEKPVVITELKCLVVDEDWHFCHQKSVWMTNESFRGWVENIFRPHINKTRQNPDEPVLLVVDGHASRAQGDVMGKLASNNIHVLVIAAHTSHILQALDLKVNRVFKEQLAKYRREDQSAPEGCGPGYFIAQTPSYMAHQISDTFWLLGASQVSIRMTWRSCLTIQPQSTRSPSQKNPREMPYRSVDVLQHHQKRSESLKASRSCANKKKRRRKRNKHKNSKTKSPLADQKLKSLVPHREKWEQKKSKNDFHWCRAVKIWFLWGFSRFWWRVHDKNMGPR